MDENIWHVLYFSVAKCCIYTDATIHNHKIYRRSPSVPFSLSVYLLSEYFICCTFVQSDTRYLYIDMLLTIISVWKCISKANVGRELSWTLLHSKCNIFVLPPPGHLRTQWAVKCNLIPWLVSYLLSFKKLHIYNIVITLNPPCRFLLVVVGSEKVKYYATWF